MSDTEIIYIFIKVSVPDDHPSVYQYIMGKKRSKETAVNNIVKLADGVLSPPYTFGHIRTVARRFLKEKEEEYQKGLIKIKPIY
jgi:hypothetical protein